ncbi:MAG TPA: alpha/beta fold hydrolase [Candidatus Dormibacteraeota bacterium]|nr:alpha/beta fold hydrolase [Candidatus Dormibacteraeota bacterium]
MTSRQSGALPQERIAPYWLDGDERGVLLLHGFAGTPPEMRPLGDELARRGLTVYAPLLAGHGTSPEQLEQTGYRDWVDSANEALDRLYQRCKLVGLAGQSMGATLALHLAATRAEPRVVVSHAGFLRLRDWRGRLLPVLQHLVRWDEPSGEVDLYEREAIHRLYSYDRRPTRAINELSQLGRVLESELPSIFRPLLLLQGGRDSIVDPSQAERIIAGVTSDIRGLQVFPRSGHGLSVDVDREEVARVGADWLERYLQN